MRSASTGGTIRLPKSEHFDVDAADFSFAKFSATYFQSGINGQYSAKPLKKSLLDHDLPMDEIAAQAVWIIILRFMGDMVDAKFFEGNSESKVNAPKTSVMEKLTKTLTLSRMNSREYQQAIDSMGDQTQQRRLMRKTLRRKTKLPELLRSAWDNNDEMEYYQKFVNTRMSNLEKLHFIIGLGILKPNLRDEILCQICKQLIKNPNRTSLTKGWILLSLCMGCFPPSPRFENYLKCFLQHGPVLYGPYCLNRLNRTIKNGPRTQPPSWMELQSSRNKNPITLEILLMDGNVKKLQIDSASIAQEAVQQLIENVGLIDAFGFSLVISMNDKIMSLGSGREHIMDAISNCEQYAKEQGQNERKAVWKLYLRKEIFTAWYDPRMDPLATNLIYKQICQGLHWGELICRTEKDVAMICALQYYAEYGGEIDEKTLYNFIPNCVPKDLLISGEKALHSWMSLIKDTFKQHDYVRTKVPQQTAKEDICLYSHLTWPMLFSRYFEAVRIEGPKLLTDQIIIAVNANGVYFIDETEQVLAELNYVEISKIFTESCQTSPIDILQIETVQMENFTFNCCEAKDITDLIMYMIKNLKMRSKYCIALVDIEPEVQEDKSQNLRLNKGDLIELDANEIGTKVMKNEITHCWGVCNNIRGKFPSKSVTVLASLSRPSENILKIYKDMVHCTPQKPLRSKYSTEQRLKMHTLRKFSQENFRSNLSKSLGNDELWQYSKRLLKAPLLKHLQQDYELFEQSITMFHNILRYMGDIPGQRQQINTDYIFKPVLQMEPLRDELFCQLMKQLTDNPGNYSEERGWDLLYLATGVTYPTSLVMRELQEFLRTRTHELAAECLKRVKRTLSTGQRKHPPYAIEVEGIQQRFMHIYHKIYFPDGTVEAFEIESCTRGQDLATAIGTRLRLRSLEGFCLFVKIDERIFSIPENDFVFDFITDLMQWIKENMPSRSGDIQTTSPYLLYFMKKLWLNTLPGKDRNADIMFYYPQEVPKYLAGYYRITQAMAIEMSALIYLAEYGQNFLPLQRPYELMGQIVPEDVIELQKVNEWKAQIALKVKTYLQSGMDDTMAKKEFLMKLSHQEMFGSTFFEVKQSNDDSFPETLYVAINSKGFHLIDPTSKNLILSHGYADLSFWSSGNTYFHIRFGNMIGASKLLCSTSQGYKIDDLLKSYVNYFNSQNK